MSTAKTTEWRVVALSGKTADGRTIAADDLEEMAAQYDPKIYTARINLEHFRLLFPYEDMSGLGDVVALKTQKQGSKTALLAKLKVNDNLQKMWDSDQKVFSSIEIASPFADTGKAYLVGLAVTDSPASLGTARHFSVAQTRAATNHSTLSEYIEMSTPEIEKIENHQAETATAAEPESKHERGAFSAIIDKLFGRQSDIEKAAAEAKQAANESSEKFAAMKQELDDAKNAFSELAEKHKELAEKFAALEKRLQETPTSGDRSPHVGGGDLPETDF